MADPAGGKAQAGGSGAFSSWEFMLAFRYLRAKRREGGVTLISIIAVAGIALAVTALITVMSVMNGFRHELLSRLLGVQAHIYVYGAAETAEDADALAARLRAEIDGVRQAGPIVVGTALAQGPRQATGVQVLGVRPQDLSSFDLIAGSGDAGEAGGGLVAGSVEAFGEGRNGGDLIVLGSALARSLGVSAGEEVRILGFEGAATPFGVQPRNKAYTVAAVFSAGVLDIDQITVFMPFEQASLFFNRPGGGDYIDVRLTDPSEPGAAADAVRALAPQAAVFDWRDQNRQFWTALQVERTAMRLILSILVLITAMNIISGIVMLVKNKGRDIAILRTIGASRAAATRIFLIAGATLGVTGTLIGLALGLLLVAFIGPVQDAINFFTGVNVFDPEIYYLYRLPARLDWGEVAWVTVWGFVTAVLATLPPALRAGRMDPVEALRNE